VRGSFTGAVRDHPGFFRAADRGTLFLDEIAEMPLELQAKLLRVLETRTVIPVGGSDPVAVDVRIVAATHQSLRRAVEQGKFRADLMYRLRVVPIFLPPLRARRSRREPRGRRRAGAHRASALGQRGRTSIARSRSSMGSRSARTRASSTPARAPRPSRTTCSRETSATSRCSICLARRSR
jgi:sigma54-dependent transcription regulator